MKSITIHTSEFGSFYAYCESASDSYPNISNEIQTFFKIVLKTNNLSAPNNKSYNSKLLRKHKKMEELLLRVARQEKNFLLEFQNDYCKDHETFQEERDVNIIARNIAQSFYDSYEVQEVFKNNIVMTKMASNKIEKEIVLLFSDEEKSHLRNRRKKENEASWFINELKKNKNHYFTHQVKELSKLLETEVKKDETKTKYEERINFLLEIAYHNIDSIFRKGSSYPLRSYLLSVLKKMVYLYDLDERTFSDIQKHLKNVLCDDLLERYRKNKDTQQHNFGYKIPSDTSTAKLVEVNSELIKEKKELTKRHECGEKISFDRPFMNTLQSKKVDIINSFFDSIYDCDLTVNSSDEKFVKKIMALCDKSDEIVERIFKKVLFDAQDSSNLSVLQPYEKNEALRTIYYLYPPEEELEKYLKIKKSIERLLKRLNVAKRELIIKEVNALKDKENIATTELLPSYETIKASLVNREIKFIESHAVEEFRHKALNNGKYLNYDLEIVARDILADDLPNIYNKLKRNIMYTNFVDEINLGDDREKKYREARIVQNKTLAVLQEMIAKTILNKKYNQDDYDSISYDSYQDILDDVYTNILKEERLIKYDDYYDEYELLERNFQEIKKKWDEKSSFIRALYFIVSSDDK